MEGPLCILADAEKDQKREYSKRHAQSVAFLPNLSNDEISLEECLLEYKLEGLVDECVKLSAQRKASYLTAPAHRTPDVRYSACRILVSHVVCRTAPRLFYLNHFFRRALLIAEKNESGCWPLRWSYQSPSRFFYRRMLFKQRF